MSYLADYLPPQTYTILFVILFIHTILVILILTATDNNSNIRQYIQYSNINFYCYTIISITLLLTIQHYLALTDIEQQYKTSKYNTDITNRFYVQRNFYLSLFTLIITITLQLSTHINNKLSETQRKVYTLQRQLDQKAR